MYEFSSEDAFRFINEKGFIAKQIRDELVFQSCPYCGTKSSKDKKNKFAINLKTGQFNCFRASCGAKGNMLTLARDFDFHLSDDADRYYNMNNFNDRFRKFKEYHAEKSDGAVAYCKTRGLSAETVHKYEITLKAGTDNVLVFPFKNEAGELKFIKYRKTDFKKGDAGAKEWCERDCMPILFGMNHCTDFETLVITEGQLDSLSLAEAGIKNAVSVPIGCNGFTWVPHCWDFITKFDKIVVFGDCENGKVTLADELQKRFRNVFVVRVDDYKGCKDANEILQNHGWSTLVDAVANAEPIISEKIKDMAEVEAVDLEKIPKISTGIKQIDSIIGGMYEGQAILLTGQRGNGKSTFANQLVNEALSQDKNCFIYSGELPNFFVKSWIDTQLCGRGSLTNSMIDKCNSFYRRRLFIYDNSIVSSENEDISVLAALEEVFIKKDVKFAVIDNLMTAIECNSNSDLYRKQSEFVGKLARLSKQFNTTVVLVAHPRKSVGNADFTNDDVSGSADVTNRVDLVMSYDRFKNDDGTEQDNARRLKITKNRLTGRLGEVKLLFQEHSKRISDSNDFEKNWLDLGFVPVDKYETIPFMIEEDENAAQS